MLVYPTPDNAKPRVLVVDDNHDAADTLASLLTMFDCTVSVSYSGADAVALGDLVRPQLVILDVAMPQMDGCETALRMRERGWGREARFVAITAWGDEETRRNTRAAGIDFHLVKPVTIECVLGLLTNVGA
jgi:CheY-like chemotaxis protein